MELARVTLPATRILRWLVDFWRICADLHIIICILYTHFYTEFYIVHMQAKFCWLPAPLGSLNRPALGATQPTIQSVPLFFPMSKAAGV